MLRKPTTTQSLQQPSAPKEEKLLAPPPPAIIGKRLLIHPHTVRSLFVSIIGGVLLAMFAALGLDALGMVIWITLPVAGVVMVGAIYGLHALLR